MTPGGEIKHCFFLLILWRLLKSLESWNHGYKSSQARQGIKLGNPTHFCECFNCRLLAKSKVRASFCWPRLFALLFPTQPPTKLLNRSESSSQIDSRPSKSQFWEHILLSLPVLPDLIRSHSIQPAQISCLMSTFSCYLSDPKFIASKI